MRKLMLLLLALAASAAPAWSQGGTATNIRNGGTLPALCTVGQVFFLTTASPTIGMWECTSTNTWSLPGSGVGVPRLDQVLNPTANKTFTMGVNSLTFNSTNASGDILTTFFDPVNAAFNITSAPAVYPHQNRAPLFAANQVGAIGDHSASPAFGTGSETPAITADIQTTIFTNNAKSATAVSIEADPPAIGGVGTALTEGTALWVPESSYGNPPSGAHVYGLLVGDLSGWASTDSTAVRIQDQSGSNWAIKTGLGKVEFGDVVQVDNLTASQCVGTDSNKHLASNTNCSGVLPTQYKQWLACDGKGIGDGLNAIPAGTYLMTTCRNTTGVTVTITGLKCFTDNNGTSTLNASGQTLGALLTGAVTCTTSYASGTQSANIALTANDYINFTFVADGTSKQTDWIVSGTF